MQPGLVNGAPVPSDHPFRSLAAALVARGYRPVPTKGKAAFIPRWTEYQFKPADAETYADCNVGLICDRLIALDVDILDHETVLAVRDALRTVLRIDDCPRRIGKAPKELYLMAAAEPGMRKRSVKLLPPGKAEVEGVEFLATGQQFVAYGTHPDTGQPYRWNGAGEPIALSLDDLLVIDRDDVDNALQAVYACLTARGWRAPVQRATSTGSAIATRDTPQRVNIEGVPQPVLDALAAADPDDRESWIAVGHALKASGEPWAEDAWRTWSEQSPKWRDADAGRWEGFIPQHSNLQSLLGATHTLPFDAVPVVPASAEPAEPWTLRPTQAVLDAKPAPVRFVIDGWMQQGKVGLIAAEGGAGKTTLALHMGVCIALALPFMGQPVTTPGPFVLLSRDDDQDDLDAVLAEVCLAMDLTAEQRAIVQRDVYAVSLRHSSDFLMIRAQDRKGYRASSFVPALLAEIARIKPVALVVDTVRQFTGIESTDEGGQIVFMSIMAQLATLGPSVICLHHVGKQAAREKIVDMYSAIGSSALSDNARFMWRLLKLDPTEDGVVLPFAVTLRAEQSLMQLISTRGSLRVKQPEDIWYTREEFTLMPIEGSVRKLNADEKKAVKLDARRVEALDRLRQCFAALGVVGRDRATAWYRERGWRLDNNTFSALKAEIEEEELLK